MDNEIKVGMHLRNKSNKKIVCKVVAMLREHFWGEFNSAYLATCAFRDYEPIPPEPLPCPWCRSNPIYNKEFGCWTCESPHCSLTGPRYDEDASKWNYIAKEHRVNIIS